MELRPEDWVPDLRRPEGLSPPHDRRLDASYSLDRDSLDSINPRKWLDDGVINTFFRSLCVAKPGQFVTFDSVALDILRRTQADIDEDYNTFRIQAATVTANAGLVFMPFCVNSHWVLAVADFQHRIIRIYDSLVSNDSMGRDIQAGDEVEIILPIVKRTLSFCHDEDQWQVEHMWLPIVQNYTDCGVYICLMALQHSHMRGFTALDYVRSYCHEDGYSALYNLDDCYFLAGRLTILQVCRRSFRRAEDWLQTFTVENRIILELQRHLQWPPAQVHSFNTYHQARSYTLDRIMNAFWWFISSIGDLGSPRCLQENQRIQVRAREVLLSEAGEPFRDEIADEARLYAWHDAEAAINFRHDLLAAWAHLKREDTNAGAELEMRAAWEAAQPALAVVPTGHSPSITQFVTPFPSEVEESETES